MTIRKFIRRVLVSGIALILVVFILPLSLVGALLHGDASRAWILQHAARSTGFEVRIGSLSFSPDPPRLILGDVQGDGPDGLNLTVEKIGLGLEIEPWLAGHIPSLHLQRPRLMLSPAAMAETGTTDPVEDPTLPLPPLPPFPLDRLQVIDGSIVLPASAETPALRLEEVGLFGEELSPRGMNLIFAAIGQPGGTLQGQVVVADGAVQIAAEAMGASAAPLLRLVNVPATAGTLDTRIEVSLAKNGHLEATATGRLERLRLQSGWDGTLQWQVSSRDGERLNLHATGLVRPPGSRFSPITLSGDLSRSEKKWHLRTATATIDDWLQLEGSGDLLPAIDLRLKTRLAAPWSLAGWLGRPAPEGLAWHPGQSWRGDIHLHGSPTAPDWRGKLENGSDQVTFRDLSTTDLKWRLRGKGSLPKKTVSLSLSARAKKIVHRDHTVTDADFRLNGRGTLPGKGVSFQLRGSAKKMANREISASNFTLELDGKGNRPREELVFQLKSTLKNMHVANGVLTALRGTGDGRVRWRDGSWRLRHGDLEADRVRIAGESLPLAWSGSARGDLAGNSRVDGGLKVFGAHLKTGLTVDKTVPLRLRVETAGKTSWNLTTIPQNWLAGAQLAGQARGGLTMTRKEREWHGEMDLKLSEGGWTAATAPGEELPSLLVEGFEGGASSTFVRGDSGAFRFDGRLRANGGEWLAGSSFGNLSGEKVDAKVTLRRNRKRPWSLTTTLRSRTLPATFIRLQPDGGGFRGQLKFHRLNLQPLFDTHLRELFMERDPGWQTAQIGGKLSANLVFRKPGTEKPALNGNISLKKGHIVGPGKKWRIQEIALELPIDETDEPHKKKRRPGRLLLNGIESGGLRLPKIVARPRWQGDTLSLAGSIHGTLYQGRYRLDGVRLTNLWSPQRRGDLSLKLDGLDLAELTGALGTPAMTGKLSADLGGIVWQNGRLQSNGSASAELFDGLVRITRIRARGLDSAMPLWRLDAEVDRIDLEAATRRLEVGIIQGTLSGNIQNLVLAGGIPISFQARFGSVESRKPQRISVKALETIQTLGTGLAGNPISRGMMSLFKNYRYSRFGFGCRLENDIFYLNGIDQHGNEIKKSVKRVKKNNQKEYLVVGSLLPPTVEVINFVPIIDWKEMIQRLKSVGLAGEVKTTFGAPDR